MFTNADRNWLIGGVVFMVVICNGFGRYYAHREIIATTCADGGYVESGGLYCYEADGSAERVTW
jgi:hypothetical protein